MTQVQKARWTVTSPGGTSADAGQELTGPFGDDTPQVDTPEVNTPQVDATQLDTPHVDTQEISQAVENADQDAEVARAQPAEPADPVDELRTALATAPGAGYV